MNTLERRATLSIGTLFSFRMLGLFMILPVFSPFAQHLPGATPLRIGLALGIYGLTQALFQLPLGALSDRYSRKPIIALGFTIFIIGSLFAAFSHNLTGMIVGRALQGAGAVGSTLIALLTDLTHAEKRSKAMAILGVTIGISFFLAMILGPIFNHWIGVRGIFGLTALLGACAIGLLFTVVPTPPATICTEKRLTFRQGLPQLLRHPALLSLDVGIFCLHTILTALFVVLPLQLHQLLVHTSSDWQIYVPSMVIAIIFTFGLIGWAESKKRVIPLYRTAIFGLIIAVLLLWRFHASLWSIGVGLTLFFIAFNVLEANLPSLISRLAPPSLKGTAIGVYSTCQYLGLFLGGVLGGWLYGHTSPATVLFVCAIIGFLWLIVALVTKINLAK